MVTALTLAAWFVFWAGSTRALGGGSSLSEYEIKSLFLLNFAKYVDWPSSAFSAAGTPIVICVSDEDDIGSDLAETVEGKSVDGRPIRVQRIRAWGDLDKCHILFIGASEKSRLADILNRVRGKAILTVGETDQFMEQGGAINFVNKEGKIRLEINMDATHQAALHVSSKLLNVADVVRGKPR